MPAKTAKKPATKKTEVAPQPVSPRMARILAFTQGKTFKLAQPTQVDGPFTCICGGPGKHAWVVKDQRGRKTKVGTKCLFYCGLTPPKKVRA